MWNSVSRQVYLNLVDERYERPRRVTFGELRRLVSGCINRIKHLPTNSAVALYATNSVESIVVAMAAASQGMLVTTIPPDFGADAFLERAGQLQPKVLFASRHVFYNGRFHDQMSKVDAILAVLPRDTIVLHPEDLAPADDPIRYRKVPFQHPLYVLYSSGTTGKPKCIIHGHGGTLVQHIKEHKLHGDVRRGDVVFQYTSIGWMMWHWALSVLACGATLVLFDGSPLKPDATALWKRLTELEVTHFGSSAKYYMSLPSDFGLDSALVPRLRMLFSTGSPLPAETFARIYKVFAGRDLIVASITGGTDIVSLFCGGCPMLPVHAGEIQCKCLGMAVDVIDGDLVCTKPFPCMPIGFVNDATGKAYRDAYFNRHPEVWTHGDFVRINPKTGGISMLGRSDCTLNPKGIRFGSADLYHALVDVKAVGDALAVPIRRADLDEDVWLFIKLAQDCREDLAAIEATVKQIIRDKLSPRHVPAKVIITPDIPYTVNGKKIELAIRRILNGQRDLPVECANPDCLQFYRDLAPQ